MDKTGDVGGVWLWRRRRLRACHRSILNVVGHAVGGACCGLGRPRRVHTWNLLVELKGISQTLGKRSR